MSLRANRSSGDFQLIPQGTYVARCVQCIDKGLQQPKNSSHKPRYRVLFGWELYDVPDFDEPPLLWREFTVSLHEMSHLRPFLEEWRGRDFTPSELDDFDLASVVGAPCLLKVYHNRDDQGRTWANVKRCEPVEKNTKVPPQEHETVIFDIDNWDDELFETFGKSLQEKIKAGRDLLRATHDEGESEKQSESFKDDDIPF